MADKTDTLPANLKAEFYPNSPANGNYPSPQFPEQTTNRYNPAHSPIGVALSGGGPRAYCCAHGQMAWMNLATDGFKRVGAISCVSGGAWFGSLLSYADPAITDAELFGEVTVAAPGSLSLDTINADINPRCLLSNIPNLTNTHLIEAAGDFYLERALHEKKWPLDKVYNRLINHFFCKPFGLDDLDTAYTADGVLGSQGTSLDTIGAYKLRDNRPFFIANTTQQFPVGEGELFRRFEFTSLYTGMPQEFAGAGKRGQDLGYGYVESFGFNTGKPSAPDGNIVSVATPENIAILSDAIGSSSAAFGGEVAKLLPHDSGYVDPSYSYWPMKNVGNTPAEVYQIVDGGVLENTGVVALLQRGFPLIYAFVNTPYPLGSSSSGCVDGVDGQISRLFGFNPQDNFGNSQDTQVFQSSDYKNKLLKQFNASASTGGVTFCLDTFEIKPDNNFGINPALYPDGARICWVYNNMIESWRSNLPDSIKTLLTSTNKDAYYANFPNFSTVDQNNTDDVVPELLFYWPGQANLLGNMWYNGPGGDPAFVSATSAALDRI